MARCRLPFSFNVVTKFPAAQGKRKRAQVEQEEDPPTPEPRTVRRRMDSPNVLAQINPPGNEQIHPPVPEIDHQDVPEAVQSGEGSTSSSPPQAPLLESSRGAGSSSVPLDAVKLPNQANAPPTTDGECAPTLTEVNPESGPITGGARIWLKGMNFPALFSLFARFGTAVVPTVSSLTTCEALSNRLSQTFSNPYLLACTLPSATVPGVVNVTLSKHPQQNAPEYGTSIAKFHYLADHDQL
jgi:hypothetical protein